MSIIKEICEKYDGVYSAEAGKKVTTPEGTMSFQFQKGELFFEGKKIIVMIDGIGGAAYGTNPFQIVLQIENSRNRLIRIYPKFFIDRVLDLVLNRETKFIPKELRRKFQFNGDRKLLGEIVSDKKIARLILDKKITLYIRNKNPNKLILSPSRGIRDIEEANLFFEIIKSVGEKI